MQPKNQITYSKRRRRKHEKRKPPQNWQQRAIHTPWLHVLLGGRGKKETGDKLQLGAKIFPFWMLLAQFSPCDSQFQPLMHSPIIIIICGCLLAQCIQLPHSKPSSTQHWINQACLKPNKTRGGLQYSLGENKSNCTQTPGFVAKFTSCCWW